MRVKLALGHLIANFYGHNSCPSHVLKEKGGADQPYFQDPIPMPNRAHEPELLRI